MKIRHRAFPASSLALLLFLALFGAACTSIDEAAVVDQPPPVPPAVEQPAPEQPAPEQPTSEQPTSEKPAAEEAGATRGESPQQAAATVPLDVELPVDPAVRVGRLENGLRYYIKANQKPEERAELRLVVNAGSILEDADQLGLAHFVEHMAFNGTENFEKLELVDYLQSIGMRFGADINAATGFDETTYRLTVPTDDPEILDTAFLVLGDWAGRVTFDAEEVDKERGVVVEEWRRSQGAGMRLFDRQLPVIFGGSLYTERLPIGTKDSIETSPAAALERFYDDWYRPDLQAVIAVGDFDPDTVEGLIRKHLGDLEGPEDPRPRPSFEVPGHPEPRFSIETDPELTSTSVAVLFKHQPQSEGTAGDYRRGLVEGLYNQMFNARLGEIAQRPDPPFVFAFSGGGAMVRGTYLYQLDARVAEGGIASGLEAVLREVERVDRHGFTAGELERAKREVERSYEQIYKERDKQPSAGFASEYSRAFLTGESIPGIEYEVALAERFLPEITLEEVNALGDSYITDENQVFLVSAPEKDAETLPDKDRLLAVYRGAEGMEVEPWVDRTREEPLLAEKPEPGEVVETVRHEELGLTEWHLSNGVRVVLKPTDFQNDQIVFSGFSPGGTSLVEDEDYTSASFATFLLSQGGLGAFDSVELQKALAGKVASASPFLLELQEGMRGAAAPDDLETALQLLYLWFTEPRLDLEAYENLVGRMGAMLVNRSKNPATAYGDKLQEVLSGGHYRSRPLTVERLEEIDPHRALEIYRDRYADASDFTFVVVGNFEVEKIRPLVETYLGGLPSTSREETWRDIGVEHPEGAVRFEVEKGIEPKASVDLIFHGDAEWQRQNRFELRSLARVLEIRLTELVREEMGATYSVSVGGSMQRWPETRFSLRVSFTCDPGEIEEILETVFADLEKVRRGGPAAERVEKVRENLRREREVQLRQNGFWMSALQTYYEHDLDLENLLNYDELLATLSPEALQGAANRYLDMDRYVLGIFKPEPGAGSEGEDGEAGETRGGEAVEGR